MNQPEPKKYPVLEAVFAIKNLPLQPMCSVRKIASIFGVTPCDP